MKRKIQVIISDAEFAREFHYFVTVQSSAAPEKIKSETSKKVNKPIFNSKFTLVIRATPTTIEPSQYISFGVFITESDLHEESSSIARFLGECKFELDEIAPSLLADDKEVIKQLKFIRVQKGKQTVVGKFTVSFSLLGMIEVSPQNQEHKVQQLPNPRFGLNCKWRMNIDLRCANDAPMGAFEEIPSLYTEFGWTKFNKKDINIENIKTSSVIETSRHPLWNEKMYYDNPSESDKVEGYFWTIIKTKKNATQLEKFCISLGQIKPHHPYNFVFV